MSGERRDVQGKGATEWKNKKPQAKPVNQDDHLPLAWANANVDNNGNLFIEEASGKQKPFLESVFILVLGKNECGDIPSHRKGNRSQSMYVYGMSGGKKVNDSTSPTRHCYSSLT